MSRHCNQLDMVLSSLELSHAQTRNRFAILVFQFVPVSKRQRECSSIFHRLSSLVYELPQASQIVDLQEPDLELAAWGASRVCYLGGPVLAGITDQDDATDRDQIGRASCRERG